MKKILACICAVSILFGAIFFTAGNVFAFTVVDNADEAVAKNKALFLKLLDEAKVDQNFTAEDLENLLFGACEYSADKYIGTGFMVEKFRIVAPTSTKAGYMSADVIIYQDDAEDGFEVKKEIPATGNPEDDENDTGTNNKSNTKNISEADAKKQIAAAKKAINAAIWEFPVSNDTTYKDILNMAKEALDSDSDVTVTLPKSDFKMTRATTQIEGSLSATLTLICGDVEDRTSVGKTVPKAVTATSTAIDEDRHLMSVALSEMIYTNRTTKEEMLAKAQNAAVNGSKAEWKEGFYKKKANFEEEGLIQGYLEITLGEESREVRISENIAKLVRDFPKDYLSVNAEEWEVLRIVNVERYNAGDRLLTMTSPLQDACDIREPEVREVFSHTRPNGTLCFTAIPNSFAYTTAGENIYSCPTGDATAKKAMTGWMNSKGHRENILKSGYCYIGVGMTDYNGVQLFGGRTNAIVKVRTSTGSMYFEDEDDMQKAFLICEASDGLLSYMPIDTSYMSKDGNRYTLNISLADPVVLTVGEEAPASEVTTKAGFSDVPDDAYYADAVSWAVKNSVTSGTSKYAFSPDMTCTKAQILTFLWRALGEPDAGSDNPFIDVDKSDYYYGAALWAAKKGIISGGRFDANTPCTRAMTVTYLWKCSNEPLVAKEANFSDVARDSEYFNAVSWAVESNVTSGTGDGKFSPDAICSRAQIVTFLNRAING